MVPPGKGEKATDRTKQGTKFPSPTQKEREDSDYMVARSRTSSISVGIRSGSGSFFSYRISVNVGALCPLLGNELGKPTIRQQPPLLRDCLFILVRKRDKRKAKLIYRIECEARFWDGIALCPSNKIDRHTHAKKCRSVTMCVCALADLPYVPVVPSPRRPLA